MLLNTIFTFIYQHFRNFFCCHLFGSIILILFKWFLTINFLGNLRTIDRLLRIPIGEVVSVIQVRHEDVEPKT